MCPVLNAQKHLHDPLARCGRFSLALLGFTASVLVTVALRFAARSRNIRISGNCTLRYQKSFSRSPVVASDAEPIVRLERFNCFEAVSGCCCFDDLR